MLDSVQVVCFANNYLMGSGLSGVERNPPFEQPVAEVKQNGVWKHITEF